MKCFCSFRDFFTASPAVGQNAIGRIYEPRKGRHRVTFERSPGWHCGFEPPDAAPKGAPALLNTAYSHGSRLGLSPAAPIGAEEPSPEYGIHSTNFSYTTLTVMAVTKVIGAPLLLP